MKPDISRVLSARIAANQPVALATIITGPCIGQQLLVLPAGADSPTAFTDANLAAGYPKVIRY